MKTESIWAITKDGAEAVQDIRAQISGRRMEIKSLDRRPKQDVYGQPIPQMEVRNGIAVIPINGPMSLCEPIDKLFGMVSYEDIIEDLLSAPRMAKGAVLNFNSPGGSCIGLADVGACVAQLKDSGFQLISFTGSVQCSAAYYIGAGCDMMTCTRGAAIGSIGTTSELIEFSKMLEDAGVTARQFSSGKYKGAGSPYIAPTEDHLARFQDRVNHFATDFFEQVAGNRPGVDSETMQGQWFTGNEALDVGLVDEVVKDLNEVISLF